MRAMSDLSAIATQIVRDVTAENDWGQPAQYIPELANVPANRIGLAIVTQQGEVVRAGDADTPFSIQSISKVFALAATLQRIGPQLWSRVGREPSGDRFDSITLLEQEAGRPRNPFVNAGALVTTDALLAGRPPAQALAEILGLVRDLAEDDAIHIDADVARSEKATGARNKALAHYLDSHGNLLNEPDFTLGTYFHQCAIAMTCVQLAQAGRTLAGLTGAPPLIAPHHAKRINALMLTCGHYDGSGDFAFRVGLPGKSGVGGGILIIVPRRASIAIWSPGLNAYGNSQAGTRAAEQLARETGWSVF